MQAQTLLTWTLTIPPLLSPIIYYSTVKVDRNSLLIATHIYPTFFFTCYIINSGEQPYQIVGMCFPQYIVRMPLGEMRKWLHKKSSRGGLSLGLHQIVLYVLTRIHLGDTRFGSCWFFPLVFIIFYFCIIQSV